MIHSPGFPESYPQGSGYTCTYQLSIIGEGYITLSFEDFHLHDGPVFTCKNNGTYDYLTINLHNNQSPIYACGVGRPATIIAPKETVTVELVVHAAPSSATFRGFQMRYSFISEEKKIELSSNFHVESTVVPMFEMEEGRFSAPQINPLLPGYTSQSIDSICFYPPYIPAPMLLITDGPTSKSKALQHGVNMANSPFQSSQRFMFVQLKGTVGQALYLKQSFHSLEILTSAVIARSFTHDAENQISALKNISSAMEGATAARERTKTGVTVSSCLSLLLGTGTILTLDPIFIIFK
ncbi:hypothetical protein BSL78_23465 [Apostichopus japonicus]|uniref:CUB domain-containing protein n=1 Tax=Stichopus japonicus TaxID=307972 RepID=A0A2G8JVA0_STIJA|nr:hypothetical protein BSL78_23465 [Apostichopus japonicus]